MTPDTPRKETEPIFFNTKDAHIVPPGTITATVSQDLDWGLELSGEGEGWSAAGQTITLRPLAEWATPALYTLNVVLNPGFSLILNGLQISMTAETGDQAVAAYNSPLTLISKVSVGRQRLNLVIVVQAEDGETHSFDDPTIVFDPPLG
jgi:hypothetical protein